MTDQTRPEIMEVQLKNKAKKYQKDNYDKIMEIVHKLDLEHLAKLTSNLQELHRIKFFTTDHFKEFRKNG